MGGPSLELASPEWLTRLFPLDGSESVPFTSAQLMKCLQAVVSTQMQNGKEFDALRLETERLRHELHPVQEQLGQVWGYVEGPGPS